MEQFLSESDARAWSAGLFLATAAVLGLVHLAKDLMRSQAAWPFVLVSTLVCLFWIGLVLLADRRGLIAESGLVALAAAGVLAGVGLAAIITERVWLTGPAFTLLGGGALLLPAGEPGGWLVGLAAVVLAGLVFAVVLSGAWWAPGGFAAAAFALLVLGGWSSVPTGRALAAAAGALERAEPALSDPWWLLTLLLIPVVVWLSFQSLAGLGPVRRWLVIGLRCLLVLMLALALADLKLRYLSKNLQLWFVKDSSLSVPRKLDPNEVAEGAARPKDLQEQALLKFIEDAVALRGPTHQEDATGLIVFADEARVERPPSNVPRLRLSKIESPVNRHFTNIANALKVALGSFTEGTGKRIVLISDGNHNRGRKEDVLEVARLARERGVEIDVVPLVHGERGADEVAVERVEAPQWAERDARVTIRILLRNYSPKVVNGTLKLIKKSVIFNPGDDKGAAERTELIDATVYQEKVTLPPGELTPVIIRQPPAARGESFSYEAVFIPDGLPGDHIENNRAGTTIITRGEKKVLLVEPEAGQHKRLLDRLQQAKPSLKLTHLQPGDLRHDPEELTLFLSSFDCVILANLTADSLTEQQQKVLRSNTHDQGCGLIMIGGRQSFGAGGWQGTEVEKALPVTCDLKSLEVGARGGLVLIMHASEIPDGVAIQKQITKLAIEKLSPIDMVGLLYYDFQAPDHKWHIPFKQIGQRKRELLRLVDKMMPGDMPDAEPSLKKALNALSDPAHNLGTKHIIFISDGDHWQPPVQVLQEIKRRGITCTTVCVTSHGQGEYDQMAKVAKLTGGRSYPPRGPDGQYKPISPKELPAIYTKETRIVSKAFVHEQRFEPELKGAGGPVQGLDDLKPLHGFVRTTPRPSPLVSVPIQTPKMGDSPFPILAYWQYGLGRAVAFTSDAQTGSGQTSWDRDWASSKIDMKFWGQVVEWTLRSVEEDGRLKLETEQRDGKVIVRVTGADDKGRKLADLDVRGGLTTPSLKPADPHRPPLRFQQEKVGVYKAEFAADEIGSYFINVQAQQRRREKGPDGKDRIVVEPFGGARSGVTVSYSSEFNERESDAAFLAQLAALTGGKVYDEEDLKRVASSTEIYREPAVHGSRLQSVWPWLALLAGVGLFFDVAVRRIAIDQEKVAVQVREVWQRLRGQAVVASKTPEFLDRLKERKAEVGQTLERPKAQRRFEGGPVSATPPGADASAPAAPPRHTEPAPRVAPEPEAEAGDYASRLLRAKRRAMQDRDEGKER